jgi:hypothetical protein
LVLSGLYYKHTTIVNYTSSFVNKLEALLTDDTGVIIYDRHVFIVQATGPTAATCGLYYKHTTIVNYTSSVINKLEALLTDDTGVIIYDRHVFIVQATG